MQQFPVIGGHEGAGEVLEVGAGVTDLKPGDHVVFGFIPSCGQCPSCSTGHQNLCDLGAYLLAGRQVTDFTSPPPRQGPGPRDHVLHRDVRRVHGRVAGAAASRSRTTSRSTRRRSSAAASRPAGAPPCTRPTCRPARPSSSSACGGVGMNAVQGASMAGARHVVAVDPLEFKREQAQIFGATHSAAVDRGGDGTGRRPHVGRDGRQGHPHDGRRPGRVHPAGADDDGRAAASCRRPSPFSVDNVSMNLFELTMYEKQLVGSIFGSANPRRTSPACCACTRRASSSSTSWSPRPTPSRTSTRLPGHARRHQHPRHAHLRPRLTPEPVRPHRSPSA